VRSDYLSYILLFWLICLLSLGGIYNSPDEYFDTVSKLWTAMTFYNGNAALNPKCRWKLANGKICSQVAFRE
jgi:hypothetical protein